MAVPDWTDVPDSNLLPGKPIRSIDVIAIKDHAEAVAGGALNAPRVVGYGAKRLADYDVLSVAASNSYNAAVLGTRVVGDLSTSTTVAIAYTYTVVLASGVIRFNASHRLDVLGDIGYLFINKNGVRLETWSTTSTSATARTRDVTVAPGDIIQWGHFTDSGISNSIISSISQTASDTYVERPLYIPASQQNTV